MANFCSGCGTQTQPAAKFCAACGKPLSPNVQPPVQQAQQHFIPQQPQYAQQEQQTIQGGSAMLKDKQTVLAEAPNRLNRPDQPWEVTIQGDSIVARWKWMDATFFSPHEINDETRNFTYTVTLANKGTWKEQDTTEKKSSGVQFSGGNLTFGGASSTFKGKTNQKSVQFGIGKNNQTGEAGIIGFKFNTTLVKQPIRDYLTACGWKKAGLFG